MKAKRRLLLGGLSVMVLAVFLYFKFHEAIDVDACQDQGGKFDYSSKTCDLK